VTARRCSWTRVLRTARVPIRPPAVAAAGNGRRAPERAAGIGRREAVRGNPTADYSHPEVIASRACRPIAASAFRAPRIPIRLPAGRGDGPRRGGRGGRGAGRAKRVMLPKLGTRKYRPAQPRHGRASARRRPSEVAARQPGLQRPPAPRASPSAHRRTAGAGKRGRPATFLDTAGR
jgi:hypothetical protein